MGRAFEGFRQRYSDRHPPLWRQAEEFHCPKNPLLHRIHPTLPSPTLYPWGPDFFFFTVVAVFAFSLTSHSWTHALCGLSDRLLSFIHMHLRFLHDFSWLKSSFLAFFFLFFFFFCSKVHIIENFSILTTFKFSGLKDISHWSCNHRHHPSPELF